MRYNLFVQELQFSNTTSFRIFFTARFIDKDHWPPNSPDRNPLNYCIWDEFVKVINWNKVTSKATMIQELKHAVKKIRKNVVFESCNSWTNLLYRMSPNNGDYLR